MSTAESHHASAAVTAEDKARVRAQGGGDNLSLVVLKLEALESAQTA